MVSGKKVICIIPMGQEDQEYHMANVIDLRLPKMVKHSETSKNTVANTKNTTKNRKMRNKVELAISKELCLHYLTRKGET